MYTDIPRRTGIYQIRDNIEQLELLVHIQHVNSLLELPTTSDLLSHTQIKNTSDEANASATTSTTTTTVATPIRWQEKLLSANELELYKKMSNCTTETQKHYHHWLQTMGTARVGRQSEAHESAAAKPTKTSKGRTKRSKQRKAEVNASLIYTYVHDDHHTSSDEQQNVKPAAITSEREHELEDLETMYIYLEPNIQLARLCWQPASRTLQIYPDFNGCHDDAYFVKDSSNDCVRLYAFVLENVSRQREVVEPFGPDIVLPLQWHLDDELSGKFDVPPKHQRRVTLLLEIHAAFDCEYDRVHVRYHTALPEGAVLEHGRLAASTHTASDAQLRGCHYFGHTWQVTLLCDEHCQNEESPLHIYFQLISIDGWERERVEGYAHYAIRLTGGRVTTRLQCIRPIDGLWDALARYFIGGRRQFDFVRFFTPTAVGAVGDDGGTDGVLLHNRLGCHMQSTAQLEFSYQCLTQRSAALLQSPSGTHKHNHTLDDIMLAYQTARKKLEALLHT